MRRNTHPDFVWRNGSHFNHKPAGLREAVLRINSVGITRRKEMANLVNDGPMKTVAKWSLGDQDKWLELLNLMGIKEVKHNEFRTRKKKLKKVA